MFNIVKKTFQYGSQQVSIETGEIARQATGAVIVNMADTVVLVTVVGAKEASPGQDFFPLTIDYIEKAYSAGKVPGGFLKREGRASEKETLVSRLIDRPLRPLFPEGFLNEVQVVAMVISLNPEVDPDIPAMIGASAALAISGIPFNGPIGAARVAYIEDNYVLNPTASQLKNSRMDLVVAGTERAVLMVESEADQLSEEIMLGAVVFGHEQMRTAINAINEMVEEAGKPEWEWQAAPVNESLLQKLNALVQAPLEEAYSITSKASRSSRIKEIRQMAVAELCSGDNPFSESLVGEQFFNIEAKIVRGRILSGYPRIDGRDTKTVRPISIRQGVLPRTHGSALFTRGETQALVIATLGTNRDEQLIDALAGEYRERFMLHYNMPPYATGECGRVGTPKRREIGHGRLAKRALAAVIPKVEDFAYCMRVVSEITESNGSSSMASVCGGSLALMDAGVPIKAHVAGIAMGLILEGNRFSVLTDILGDEDHLGDMDFKVAGTEFGITALQMDIKIQGITKDIMEIALSQAREGRMHILGLMQQSSNSPRAEMSAYAPRLYTMKINPEKIRDVIGKGGSVIRGLIEETGATIDINDDGTVTISSNSSESAQKAIDRINAITAEIEIGKNYQGTVIKILDFGAIINVLPGKDGLLHISQISSERVNAVTDYLQEGQVVVVKATEIDDRGRVKLSMKAVVAETNAVE